MHGRSRCPRCLTQLTVGDLFPVISWLASRGTCRHCGVKVSARYPITELICGALFVAVVWADQSNDLVRVALLWALTVCMLALAVIDLEAQRLPNSLVLWVFGLSAVLAYLDGQSAVGAAVACLLASVIGLLLRWLGQKLADGDGLGWGDVKLAAALAIPMTIDDMPLFLPVLAAGALALLARAAWKRQFNSVPLGAALVAGAFAVFV